MASNALVGNHQNYLVCQIGTFVYAFLVRILTLISYGTFYCWVVKQKKGTRISPLETTAPAEAQFYNSRRLAQPILGKNGRLHRTKTATRRRQCIIIHCKEKCNANTLQWLARKTLTDRPVLTRGEGNYFSLHASITPMSCNQELDDREQPRQLHLMRVAGQERGLKWRIKEGWRLQIFAECTVKQQAFSWNR